MPVAESDVETSFGRTHVLTAGDLSKPPLVAVHPLAFSSTSWLPLLPTLAKNHRITMIDAIGDVSKSIGSKAITNAGDPRIELIDDANHLIPIDQPETVQKLLGDFLC
jgi:pimeloyl-ACP methyl ester carboxylesterase